VVAAGPGTEPIYLPGPGEPEIPVYLTGPYEGAPFGLAVVIPVKGGPFDLGTVVERFRVEVDPRTARLRISSDPLPSILKGVPLQVRTLHVSIDRERFTFNPTNCGALSVDGTLTSTRGSVAPLYSRFQAANCAKLPFEPSLRISTEARSSRSDGASLDIRLSYPRGVQANIRDIVVDLPKELPSRLATIQKACTQATFDANPASCPAPSDVGTVVVKTPMLSVPLAGPAYLVSHGSTRFPELVLLLQGEGVTVELSGALRISHGLTRGVFTVPDARIDSFEMRLPRSPTSVLTTAKLPGRAHGKLCAARIFVPTTITAQNGTMIKRHMLIAVTGCSPHRRRSGGRARKGSGR
jgi:hypothetical protein